LRELGGAWGQSAGGPVSHWAETGAVDLEDRYVGGSRVGGIDQVIGGFEVGAAVPGRVPRHSVKGARLRLAVTRAPQRQPQIALGPGRRAFPPPSSGRGGKSQISNSGGAGGRQCRLAAF
jgi:hypothetical protein